MLGLLLGPSAPAPTAPAADIQAFYVDHAGGVVLQSLLVHGLAGIALVLLALGFAWALPTWPAEARWIRITGLAAAAVSFAQVAPALIAVAVAGGTAASTSKALLSAVNTRRRPTGRRRPPGASGDTQHHPAAPPPPDRPDPGPGREALERTGRGRQGLTDATSRIRGRRCELRQEIPHDEHPAEAAGNGEHRPADTDLTLFTANAASQIGNIMTTVGVPWFFLVTTGSAARTGVDLVAGHGCTGPPARTAATTSATP